MAQDPAACGRSCPAAESAATSQAGSPRGSIAISREVLDHLSCGLCRGPVAGSLLLSCSHVFCGHCLWQHLQRKQSCPTCSMALRSVPVRCLAMDKVAACIVPTLSAEEQEQYAKRSKDGQCTADKVNKMFWWLAPPTLPAAGPMPAAGAAPPPHCLPAGTANTLGASCVTSDPATSSALLPCPQGPFPPLLPAISCPPVVPPHLAAANAAASTQLLQLAAAAQQFATVHQMAQVQQQLGAAAALGGQSLPLPVPPVMLPESLGLQHMFLGGQQEQQHLGGLAAGRMGGYQQGLHLSSLMSSMCQV